MSIEGLFAGFLLFIASLLAIVMPLRQAGALNGTGVENQHTRLLQDYDRLLTNLRDLDEDYSTGKIQMSDYQIEREALVQRGVVLLKQLDKKAH